MPTPALTPHSLNAAATAAVASVETFATTDGDFDVVQSMLGCISIRENATKNYYLEDEEGEANVSDTIG